MFIRRSALGVRCSTFIVLFFFFSPGNSPAAEDLRPAVPDPEILQTIFAGNETLHYEVSWTGGIKIGDLYLQVKEDGNGGHAIHARVTDHGAFRFFYPIDDVFDTFVRGELKLPYRYEVLQREGRGSATRRLTLYDQQDLKVKYRKNEGDVLDFFVTSEVYNEFSSFYATRAMDLVPDTFFMVPTFADKKRNEVKVQVKKGEEMGTLLGKVRTIRVMPIMKFKGLYNKDGDTTIWFTDDRCRVPVKINSRILIGSLTATLVSYSNTLCGKYDGRAKN